MTSDPHTTTASLESALAEAKAKADEDTYHLELLLEAEKASHTDTLVKLRLTEERLAASEAERERLREVAEIRKRDCVEAEQALYKIGLAILGTDTVPGDYARLLDECATKIDHGNEALEFIKQHGDEILFLLGDGAADGPGARIHDELETLMMGIDLTACFDVTIDPDAYMSADHDELTDSDAAATLPMNERPGE
jgi:hypothetical protein